jgi:hypothetical protein
VSRLAPLTLGPVLAAALGIAGVRGPLAEMHHHVTETSDVYVLPPPRQVVTLSLGYRAALADLLWAHVLVSQGLHTFERRRFENLSLFIDSINELDPTFREPYLLADALFTFQANTTPREEVLKARAVMERGVSTLPLDGELWLALGQFVAFIAPSSYLPDPAEQAQWRVDGARMLARAGELGGSDATISWRALAGAGILSRAGERDAAIRFLRRTLAVTDDPELKERIEHQIEKLAGDQELELEKRRQERMAELRRRDLPFLKLTSFLLLGPPFSPYGCAGPEKSTAPACALTWQQWSEREATSDR